MWFVKKLWTFALSKFWVCVGIYKMYLISVDGYKNADIQVLIIKKTDEIWESMKDVESGMGVKNISVVVLKEIYGICETKNPTKKQINEYKMTEREIYEKFSNLSKDELTQKVTKTFTSKIMSWLLLLNAVEVKRKRNKSNRQI